MTANVTNSVPLVSEGERKFYVYILMGLSEFYYCGISQDLYKRYTDHNRGYSKSTRKHLPYVLKWLHVVDTRMKARFIEKQIKRTGVRKFYRKEVYGCNINHSKNLVEEFNFNLRAY